ncbi:Aldo keto reductase [Pyrrhoderma noxium]|uniref:Aldo keto reductase n=1 Tax=Pyrrhoderma noxium TaxID=2282107 RepID=A0A286UCH5_9AGAM|nr:Aldo keto reductase [Pyrrhoderma noxium]
MTSKLWIPFPPPATPLGVYRVLSPNAGIRVSPLQLGAMSIGDKWEKLGMGAMNKESSFKLLDTYYEAGGNFIDTANNYQDGSSEEFIGEWMESRGIRDQIVIATKYTTNCKRGDAGVSIQTNYTGNNAKSLAISVESSLKKLRTSYVDILYVHWWDFVTSIEEVMDHLHKLVLSGKVLYLGASDMPAWVVSQANQYARDHGKSRFVIYQGAWNVMARSFERDIIPMARNHGMALAPWNVLAGGRLRSDDEEERRRQTGEKGRMISNDRWERTEDERKMSLVLESIAKDIGSSIGKEVSLTAVAIAYVMQKTTHVFPIVGGRKPEQLVANIEALEIALTDGQISRVEDVLPFDPGFPSTMIGDGTYPNKMMVASGNEARWPRPQPIKPLTIQ